MSYFLVFWGSCFSTLFDVFCHIIVSRVVFSCFRILWPHFGPPGGSQEGRSRLVFFSLFWAGTLGIVLGAFLLIFTCLLDALWEHCSTFFASFWTSWGVPRGMIQPSVFHFGGLTLFVWVFLLLIFGRSLGTFWKWVPEGVAFSSCLLFAFFCFFFFVFSWDTSLHRSATFCGPTLRSCGLVWCMVEWIRNFSK